MNDFTGRVRPDEWTPPQGSIRTVTVALDTAQYQVGWLGSTSQGRAVPHGGPAAPNVGRAAEIAAFLLSFTLF